MHMAMLPRGLLPRAHACVLARHAFISPASLPRACIRNALIDFRTVSVQVTAGCPPRTRRSRRIRRQGGVVVSYCRGQERGAVCARGEVGIASCRRGQAAWRTATCPRRWTLARQPTLSDGMREREGTGGGAEGTGRARPAAGLAYLSAMQPTRSIRVARVPNAACATSRGFPRGVWVPKWRSHTAIRDADHSPA